MLDRLQNPPLNVALNQSLIQAKSVNYQAIIPTQSQKIAQENAELCEVLGAKIARPFSFSLESFYFLLGNLCKYYHVALALSSHNMLYAAYLQSPNKDEIFPLLPDFASGSITQDSIDEALDWGADCFIVPLLNEDILTLNSLESLPMRVLKVVDVSYAFALNLPLPKADIMLLNGENLGLLRPFGILASNAQDFYGISSVYLEIQNLYAVFRQAIIAQQEKKKTSQSRFQNDLSRVFLDTLRVNLEKLGFNECCYAFYQSPENTLPLGLKGIKARNLIQSLLFDGIHLINGQECLFGFASPSFVLRQMGYSEEQSRELLSLSFLDIAPSLISQIAQKIAMKYSQLRSLG